MYLPNQLAVPNGGFLTSRMVICWRRSSAKSTKPPTQVERLPPEDKLSIYTKKSTCSPHISQQKKNELSSSLVNKMDFFLLKLNNITINFDGKSV